MPPTSQLANFDRRFSFSSPALDMNTTLEVVSFEGEEALTALYRFEILLVSGNNDIDAAGLVTQPGVFRLNDGVGDSEETCYSGLIASFAQMHSIGAFTFYKAVLVPKLWQLERFHLSEVYLDKNSQQLLEQILSNAGLTSDDYMLIFRKNLSPILNFIFQYKESYFYFLSRWCEFLGAYWWFGNRQGKDVVMFGNHPTSHDDQALRVVYQSPGELDAVATEARRVQSFTQHVHAQPKQVTVSDYFYKRASQQIRGVAQVSEQGIGEINYYGLYLKTDEAAQRLARIRAEGLRCRGEQYLGESTATGLRCGHIMQLEGHYRNSFNRRYLLTRVTHRGSQAGLLLDGLGVHTGDEQPRALFYQAGFSAIPAEVQFRPEIVHPWPRIEGTLNAFIDAEGDGQYAELNDAGEYKVQLPYDMTEKAADRASAWIRMATPYAGSDHGMHFPLHKGAEVLLSFENGNPDEPVILGAVPNSLNPSVVTNENQTQSIIQTAGGNSLDFNDLEGKQGIHLFSPVSNTSFSLGATPLPLQSASASAASSGNGGTGGFFETSGTFNLTAENVLQNIGGANTVNVLGANTNFNEGAFNLFTVGETTLFTAGWANTFNIAGGWTQSIGPTYELNSTAKFKFAPIQATVTESELKSTVTDINTAVSKVQTTVNNVIDDVNGISNAVTKVSNAVNVLKTVDTAIDNQVTGIMNAATTTSNAATVLTMTATKITEETASIINNTTTVSKHTVSSITGVIVYS